ncbi:MAG: hypothetical protein LLF76_10570 [Planctomycetaceae bacterium]|nr:hypothetical protein [Planctomycetaceae bacterium]
MNKTFWLCVCILLSLICVSCGEPMEKKSTDYSVTLLTIDPGHFHASLVQKSMYPQVDPTAYVYAPAGPELQAHLNMIQQYNTRPENPTKWNEVVYTGPDYLQKAIAEKKGNVVVLAGNNQKKIEYIKAAVDAGLNVFADKPMVISSDGYATLQQVFQTADQKNLLLYDIMTERYEITTMLQKELAQQAAVFGQLKPGTAEDPSIQMGSVHYFYKSVSGSTLKRPAWFFDTNKQGEGIVDVMTHLVDLTMWEAFPEQPIKIDEVQIASARHWPTVLTQQQFKEVTQEDVFPDFLKTSLDPQGALPVYSNGQINYAIRGVHASVEVTWDYKAPEGSGDTHYSIMKGTKANAIIRQGAEENYRPELYVEAAEGTDRAALNSALFTWTLQLQRTFPGVRAIQKGDLWQIAIPDRYRVGHESHFAQVTEKYLQFLQQGKLPAWEKQNILTKYFITTGALKMAK